MTDMIDTLIIHCRKLEEQQKHDKERITYVNQLVIDLNKMHEERLNLHTETFTALLNRIEELERLTKHVLSTQMLTVNPTTNELEYPQVRFVGNITLPNPNKYMSAKEAMKALFDGHKITRENWGFNEEHNNSYVKFGCDQSVHLDYDDLIANDWYIVS